MRVRATAVVHYMGGGGGRFVIPPGAQGVVVDHQRTPSLMYTTPYGGGFFGVLSINWDNSTNRRIHANMDNIVIVGH
jgi:hypothetical protein